MRIKLDENLPESLLASLASQGHDVDNVRLELHLQGDGCRQVAAGDVAIGRIGRQAAARLAPNAEILSRNYREGFAPPSVS